MKKLCKYLVCFQLYTGHFAFYFRKNSWISEPIDQVLMRLFEAGLVSQMYKDRKRKTLGAKETISQRTEVCTDVGQGVSFIACITRKFPVSRR